MSVSFPIAVTNRLLTEVVLNLPGAFRCFEKAIDRPLPAEPDPDHASPRIFAIYAALLFVVGTILAGLVGARLDPRVKTQEKMPS